MHVYMPYTLLLNQPCLIFVPPSIDDNAQDIGHCEPVHPPFAMQVVIKQSGAHLLGEMLLYFTAQREIAKAIETLVVRQARGLYVPTMIEIEGAEGHRRFLLRGERKAWPLRERVKLMWGSDPILCCSEKWKFEFESL